MTPSSGLSRNNHQQHYPCKGGKNILCNVRLLVTQTHRSDETFTLGVNSGEVIADESGLRDHSLPGLLMRLLSGVDNLEHLLLTDTLDLRQRHRKLGGLFLTLILDSARKCLGIGGLGTVEQILWQRRLGWFVGRGRLDILLLLRLDALPHLDLLGMALLLVQLGPQTTQVLGILGLLMGFTGLALADSLVVVKTLSVLLLPALDIPGGGQYMMSGRRETVD